MEEAKRKEDEEKIVEDEILCVSHLLSETTNTQSSPNYILQQSPRDPRPQVITIP